jgi:hypothetical protein
MLSSKLKIPAHTAQATQEKNELLTAHRVAELSNEISAEHLAVNELLDGTVADGLD